ncbi:heavy metal transport/detoxification protein [Methylococcus capsulatus]|nr:heavy metal transport/detoxification protein [Methylococcus capsulatus]
MHCTGCEKIIEAAVNSLPGVKCVQASYVKAQVEIEFDDTLIREKRLRQAIEDKGYGIVESAQASSRRRALSGLTFIILLLAVGGLTLWGKSLMPALMMQMSAPLGYTMLFTIGFFTGFHCVGMCGGFVVGYATEVSPRTPWTVTAAHLQYALGKTTSYTVIGAGFGLLGSLITVTPHLRGVLALASSIFLLVYGLKMLNVFAFLRHFTLRLPRAVERGVANEARRRRHPWAIGLLNGLLLGCGPLQAMYIMAAGTGSPKEGAAILLFFGLGTLLPLLGFGVFASLLSRRVMHTLAHVSGVLVIVMGLMMAERGLKMTGSGYDFGSLLDYWRRYPPTAASHDQGPHGVPTESNPGHQSP